VIARLTPVVGRNAVSRSKLVQRDSVHTLCLHGGNATHCRGT